MGEVDALVIPIYFAATIPTISLYYVNIIFNDPYPKPPLIIPFTTMEKKRL